MIHVSDKTWNLESLYTSFDSKEFECDYEKMRSIISEMGQAAAEKFADKSDAADKLAWYIENYNDFSQYISTIIYAELLWSANTEDERAKKILDRGDVLLSDMKKPEVLFEAYVGGVEDLEQCIAQNDVLKEHAYMLWEIKARNQYLLSEKEETVMAKLTPTGSSAWGMLQSQLTSTLMVDMEIDGKMEQKPLAAVRNMAYAEDADLRKKAYEAELKAYEKIDKAVAAAINAIKGEALAETKLRGYDSILDMTLKHARMDQETLDALISAIEEYLPEMRRFYKKKAEVLGHKNGLPFYDLFAPVAWPSSPAQSAGRPGPVAWPSSPASDSKAGMAFSYDEAADYVVKQFSQFSQNLGDFAKHAFEERWIDVEPREGKQGGAFCAGIHSIKESRILTNFTGSFSDMTTLAHELGHAYHNHRMNNESYLNSDYPMPVAETASTFCETIVTNAALNTATDREKITILENMLTDNLQVIVDIYSRYTFESDMIAKREEGSLSANELKALMLSAQKKAYGDGLDENVLHPYMWLCKSHYYSVHYNFYNFPYAYGLLFAKGLYAQYLKEGESFVAKYDALLTATGKNSLADIGKIAGIDVRDKAFWKSSLELIVREIDAFCELV